MINKFIRIGVTSGLSRSGVEGNYTHISVPTAYSRALYKAGANAVYIIPPNRLETEQLVKHLDGVLLTGGIDIGPENYGQTRKEYTDYSDSERDQFEINLTKSALERNLPVLGICRGLQLINIVFGGTLYQDILKERTGEDIHNIRKETELSHEIEINSDTILGSITNKHNICVNSAHHQAIKELGMNLRATAISSDGLIEAIESEKHTWVMGVQWHPELLSGKIEIHQNIFNSFIESITNHK